MTDKTSPAKNPAKGDDRNLVAPEDAGGRTLEERLLALWQQNRVVVLAVVVAALLVIVGREAWRFFSEGRERATREAYGTAGTEEAKVAFAREHPGHPLAGMALLSVADEAYAASEYGKAERFYGEAHAALVEPVLAARARLGEGMAAIQGGAEAKGTGILRTLGDDPSIPETLRIEAWYHLAAMAVAADDFSAARERLDKLDAMAPAGLWASRAAALRARLPAEESAAAVSLPGN